uniref:Uncharacterized protein n=1 Tax=viral metagenome TaxID=1070528 RepID=A0A6C0AFB8_9ZZZZ
MLFLPEGKDTLPKSKVRIEFKTKSNIKICSIRINTFSEDIIYLKVLSFSWKNNPQDGHDYTRICNLKFITESGFYKTEDFLFTYDPKVYEEICEYITDQYSIENENLNKKIEMLEEFISCRPGGDDYLLAKQNFEDLQKLS